MQGLSESLDAIAAAIHWGEARARLLAMPPKPLLQACPVGKPTALDEAQGKDRLRALGLPVPYGWLVSGDKVPQAGLPFPVALKMICPRLAHKSEAGVAFWSHCWPMPPRFCCPRRRTKPCAYRSHRHDPRSD